MMADASIARDSDKGTAGLRTPAGDMHAQASDMGMLNVRAQTPAGGTHAQADVTDMLGGAGADIASTVRNPCGKAGGTHGTEQSAANRGCGRRERLREQTDRKIMRAALEIVVSDGVGAVTIEEVARRSGVAKTTIYRRYRNADDLLHRIQVEAAGLPDFSDLDPSRDGLRAMLQRIQDCFDSELGLKAVGAVLTSDNDALTAIAEQVLAPAEQRFSAFVNRGIVTKAFRADVDLGFLFDTVLGSMLAYTALHDKATCAEPLSSSKMGANSTNGNADGAWAAHMAGLLWTVIAV